MKFNWTTFNNSLTNNQNLNLRFQYSGDTFVSSDYHITEFKLASIQSVDCGGNLDSWNEMILQVLEPTETSLKESMEVKKLVSIIGKITDKIPIPEDAVVKIEFGNSKYAMRQLFVSSLSLTDESIIVLLEEGAPECKASSTCGLPKEDSQKISSGCGPSKVIESPILVTTSPAIKSGCC